MKPCPSDKEAAPREKLACFPMETAEENEVRALEHIEEELSVLRSSIKSRKKGDE